jgi:stage III sporulation protein AE
MAANGQDYQEGIQLKKTGFFILVFLLAILFGNGALALGAASAATTAGQTVESLDLSEIEKSVEKIDQEVKKVMPEINLETIFQDLRHGKFSWNVQDFFTGLLRYFFREVVANGALLTRLLLLAVAGAVLTSLQGTFDKGNISLISQGVVFLVLMTIALSSFSLAMNIAKTSINNMSEFLYAVMPVLLTLLAAMGGITSAALIQPLMVVTLTISTTAVRTIIFPLIYFMVVLNIVGHISPDFKVSRLAGLFKDISLGFLGILMTVFVGFLSLQGLTGAVADGLTFKAAKFAAGTFIPVVGKPLADALDTVLGTSLILKNGIGILGVIVIFLLCAMPGIKILAMSLIYRLVAAVIQPFGDSQLAEAMHSLANSLIMVFAAVAAIGLMFFFVLSVTVFSANISMMFR